MFRHFPLTEVHPMAAIAAVTAEFAGVHGQFWAAHEKLYANQARLGPELLFEIVQGLGLEPAELKAGIDADTWTEKVQEDFNGGIRSGVNGTPTFFINGARARRGVFVRIPVAGHRGGARLARSRMAGR